MSNDYFKLERNLIYLNSLLESNKKITITKDSISECIIEWDYSLCKGGRFYFNKIEDAINFVHGMIAVVEKMYNKETGSDVTRFLTVKDIEDLRLRHELSKRVIFIEKDNL